MSRFYIPTNGPDAWRAFLASPAKQWQTGFSAKTLAHSWETARGLPPEVAAAIAGSELGAIEFLAGFPEYKTPLPGHSKPTQTDLLVLAGQAGERVLLGIEGKVEESFEAPLAEKRREASVGMLERLDYLADLLEVPGTELDPMPYQLVHRTAAVLIEARRFSASRAAMIVHSFSQSDSHHSDFEAFATLLGAHRPEVGGLALAKKYDGLDLYLGWVRGDPKFLAF